MSAAQPPLLTSPRAAGTPCWTHSVEGSKCAQKLLQDQRRRWEGIQTFHLETGLWQWNVSYFSAYKTAAQSFRFFFSFFFSWRNFCILSSFPFIRAGSRWRAGRTQKRSRVTINPEVIWTGHSFTQKYISIHKCWIVSDIFLRFV